MKGFKLGSTALVVLLAVTLTGCGGVKGSVEGSNSSQGQSEPETTTEGKNTENLESGWTKLTDNELKWFNEEFFSNPVDGIVTPSEDGIVLNSFLNCIYTDVRDISLEELFYDSPRPQLELSEQEEAALSGSKIDFDTDIEKVPASFMDDMLRKYANISLEETNKVDLDAFLYLSEYDAYYLGHGDTHYTKVIVESGAKDENGIVKLQCLRVESDDKCEVTLQAHENGYYFVSNVLIEE